MTVRVFVSSTFNDLKHHRARAIAQLRGAGLFVDPMEDWPADAEEPTKFCPERVVPCQLCVLLIAFRRGWVPKGATLSITQQEIAKAEEHGIPVLPFLLHDDVTGWKFDERATDAEVDEWRKAWRPKAGSDKFHFTAEPLSLDVMPAVTRWLNTQHERERLRDYLDQIQTAHGKIKFLGLPTLKESPNKQGKADTDIADLFVEPALARDFISPDTTPEDWKPHAPLLQAMADHRHLVVLGDPGTGKSTLVNWIAWNLAARGSNPWKAELGDLVPLPFVLRDLEISPDITWNGLLDKFLELSAHGLLTRDQLTTLLRGGNAILLIDGLDEIGDRKTREQLRKAIRIGRGGEAKTCRWLLTSRIAGYDELALESDGTDKIDTGRPQSEEFSLVAHRSVAPLVRKYVVPFDDDRITEFAGKWYKAREEDRHKAAREATNLTKAIHRDGYTLRLARVPNLLTIMALVYRIESDLPHGKANLYDKIATAYLETIDKYYRLALGDTIHEKKSWLGMLAFRMQQNRARAKDNAAWDAAVVVEGDTLRGWLAGAMPKAKDDPDAPARFLERIELRSGLMVKRTATRFAFTHLSFQEYFAAVYLAEWLTSDEWLDGEGLPHGTSAPDLAKYVVEPDWREVLVFLFESLVEVKEKRKRKIREAVFGANWEAVASAVAGKGSPTVLLARLAIDPHVGWDEDTCRSALRQVFAWVVRTQQTDLFNTICHGILVSALDVSTNALAERLRVVGELVRQQSATELSLNDTAVSDLSPLASLSELSWLSLNSTAVSDLSPLTSLTRLTRLSLSSTAVTDLSPLAALSGLAGLTANDTAVSDLSPLASLAGLRGLSLNNTLVADLSPLSSLTGLKRLSLDDLAVSDVSPLTPLNGLIWLSLCNTAVADVSPLASLTGLKGLSLRRTQITSAQVAELKAKLPNCQIFH